MFLNGQFGSTDTNFGDFIPSAANPNSLSSNLGAPGGVNFDSGVVLQNEGQIAFNLLTMTALSASTVVFEADLSSVPEIGSAWTVTFAGRTSTGTSIVQVQLSLDGVNFSVAQQANLTTNDTPYTFAFAAGTSEKAYVRLALQRPARRSEHVPRQRVDQRRSHHRPGAGHRGHAPRRSDRSGAGRPPPRLVLARRP